MAIGLNFEEYVELKLMPPKHADRAFVTAAEHMRDEAFPMSLSQAAWHVRTRGYDCRPESLELLVKQQTVEPVDVDAWTRADVDAVCNYFEQHGFYVPYAEACRVLGCSYASFLRALAVALSRLTNELRVIIELRFFGELTFEKIGSVLNLPLGTVVTRFRAALKQLKACAEDQTS